MATALLALAGCGSSGGPRPSDQPMALVVEGRIAVTGTAEDTRTMLTSTGSAYRLTGGPEAELRRLEGARVRIHGLESAGAPAPRLEVRSYQVLEIDGATPWLGAVDGDGGATLTTDGGERLSLEGLPEALPAGTRIWVTGERAADTLRVHSYGVLREP